MIVLAALIYLPVWGVTVFGVAMIVAHNALDGLKPEDFGRWSGLWKILHVQSMIEVSPNFHFLVLYPLIPWVGVMAAGYGFGVVFTLDSATRRKWLMRLGLGLIAAFVVLRWSNLYGDPSAWSAQSRPLFTLFSFLNCTKYPPSLCYLLMTLGPACLLLALFERGTPAALRPVLTFGRVPMFYYLLHIPIIHGLASLWFHAHYGRADFFMDGGTGTPPADAGFSLPVVYLIWLGVVVGLYPACRWFAALKRRRHDAWLSYF
ncbi:MAG: hypothetical protein JWM35_2683 [Verrucomicrobia bacterium]|nr:hypothetical protein [Verrucomicrobiota bacterium]